MLIVLARIIYALPLSWCHAVARFFGWVWYWVLPFRVSVARRNIQRVFGATHSEAEQRRMLKACLRLQVMNAVEMLRMLYVSKEESEELVETRGFEHLRAAARSGKGCVAVTAHMGNLDMLATSQAMQGFPLHILAKEIGSRTVNQFVRALRQRTGLFLVPTRRSKELIYAALAKGDIVAFTFDQHMARHRAIVCDFFGQLASTSPSPVRFAIETGAPIIPAHLYRKGETGRFVAVCEPPFQLEMPHADLEANIRHNTQRLNRKLEEWIRAHPEQWLWLHRRWKVQDDPSGWEIPADLSHLLKA